MKLFLSRARGSVTVMVTLILVPTVFFTGFMVDLARIKLYSNQAVMTADNYGEAVLSYYDNVLKELYGLFAVTQDEDALSELETLQTVLTSSFNPNESTTSWGHVGTSDTSYSGFMPYDDAEVTLSYSAVSDANLGNSEVLSTQIGDFMKFRIAQVLYDDDTADAVISAVEEVMNTQSNAEVIDKKQDFDDAIEDLLEAAEEYYDVLKDLAEYPDYISDINSAYSTLKSQVSSAVSSTSYTTYKNYVQNEDAIQDALEHQQEIEDAQNAKSDDDDDDDEEEEETVDTLSSQEKKYIAMYEAYQSDSNARESYFKKLLEGYLETFGESRDSDPVDFDNFDSLVSKLESKTDKVVEEVEDVQEIWEELQELLEDEDVDSSVKSGIETELESVDDLIDDVTYYTGIYSVLSGNASVNDSYESTFESIYSTAESVIDAYVSASTSIPSWASELKESSYKDFRDTSSYNTLYEALEKCFSGNSSDTEVYNQKKQEAEDAEDEAIDKMSEEEEGNGARDIPSSFGMGSDGSVSTLAVSELIKSAVEIFSSNSFSEAGNALLLKFYTVEYDFGMFSDRLTNNTDDEDAETAESLTGYEMGKDINYLYQAELEYIFGGYNSSQKNLTAARNKILAFRAVMNYMATYSISEINSAIQAIADAASAVGSPLLGLAVGTALRSAICAMETWADWEAMMDGDEVCVVKSELKDMTSYDTVKSLLGLTDSVSSSESTSVKLGYEQYLMVMLVFLTTSENITERTANLITLNVNTVKQNIGESGTLSSLTFTMEKAVTAVDATCSIHLDYAVMPDGFASMVVSDSMVSELESFEKNTYKFTVTRGY